METNPQMSAANTKAVFATGQEGLFIVSPNMKCLPQTRLADLPSKFYDRPLPQQAMALSICSNKYPFLGFTLADVRWEGPLLEHLRLPSKLPIE